MVFEISELIFDGNKANRGSSTCNNPVNGVNVNVKGDNFRVHHIDTINAACGSGLEVVGSGYEIYSVYSANNGISALSATGRWADGITLLRCDYGVVRDNNIRNNTDVGLVVFNGVGCSIHHNTIAQTSQYAFAGLKIGDPGSAGTASLGGSNTFSNTITSGYNLLSFGIMVGNHPWASGTFMTDVGAVVNNTASGAVVNLAVDGVGAGSVTGNSLSSPQGNRNYGGCSYTGNFTYGHASGVTLQGGGVCLIHHSPCGCQ